MFPSSTVSKYPSLQVVKFMNLQYYVKTVYQTFE